MFTEAYFIPSFWTPVYWVESDVEKPLLGGGPYFTGSYWTVSFWSSGVGSPPAVGGSYFSRSYFP